MSKGLDDCAIVVFAFRRADKLAECLEGLRRNGVRSLTIFCDGPRRESDVPGVEAVRATVRAVDWCAVTRVERTENWGLGRSILTGVREVLDRFASIIVIEDDLVCGEGAIDFLREGLRRYAGEKRVMSVTGWSHRAIRPGDSGGQPYFDGRVSSWVWGCWRRSWESMDEDAWTLMRKCQKAGKDIWRYGGDLPVTAWRAKNLNVWAVRFHYAHQLKNGLVLKPGVNLVDNRGFDASATNSASGGFWQEPLGTWDGAAVRWPEARENPMCSSLWQAQFGSSLAGYVWKQGLRKLDTFRHR